MSGHGGGGAAVAGEPSYAGVTAGTVLTITIPAAGSGSPATVTGGTVTISANAGVNGTSGGAGGAAGSNTIAVAGGAGGLGQSSSNRGGGGGGGSAGSSTGGGTGGNGSGTSGGAAGTAGTGTVPGAAGGVGGGSGAVGGNAASPGGGSGGGGSFSSNPGGTPGGGQVVITWTEVSYSATGYAAAAGVMATARHAASAFKAYMSFTGALAPVRAVNQWAATYAQPGGFGPTPPALQSTVIELTPATSVIPGSGVPTEGNWLFLLAGWNQAGLPGVAAGGADDIHSFWRPGDVTASNWASSPKTGSTRAMIWYTANLARTAGDVYAAPSGAVAGMACTVVEIAGLGPWDVVTGINVAYSAAATTLGLSLAAPAGGVPAFTIACVCGDSSAVSQAFHPAGWSTLATVTASNGADHSCDAVLTSAILPSTSGSVSVSGTAGSASDLSGVMLQVMVAGTSPLTGIGVSPAWPGRMIYEFAPGGGYQTPPDQLTWVTLSDSASPRGTTKRAWSWNDRGGVPYSLGQLQSGSGSTQLDNADGVLTPSNSASPLYPDVVTGTPIRLRVALGTMGGQVFNRWYIIQRNCLSFDEKRTEKSYRNYVEAGLTDIWAVVAGTCPTPVRGEIAQDSPHALWPCDDGLLAGGLLPRQLNNAAAGNGNALQIIPSPNGVTQSNSYGTDGFNFSTFVPPTTGVSTSAGVATYTQPALQGWDYGDPQSSPGSAPTGNPVTASPGAAAWQMIGAAGDTGSNGWYLACHDTGFPPVANGVTLEIWINYGFFGSAASGNVGGIHVVAGQPYTNLTVWDMTTASAPVCMLQIDRDTGHLNLITYNGGTPTMHSVYTASDLRGEAFHMATVRLNQTSYAVDIDGGATASVTGSATISASAWEWLVVNGDMGSNAGSSGASLVHGGNAAFSRVAVYPSWLPSWRVRAHYWASLTGFGLIPAPGPAQFQILQTSSSSSNPPFTPDGSADSGSYGYVAFAASAFAFASVQVAQAGSYHSGPSPWAVQAGVGVSSGGDAVFTSFTGVAPQFALYTSAQVDGETLAAVVSSKSDTFTAGYGASATGVGPGQVSGGTGASPPTSASALGDTVAQRLERCMGYGSLTYTGRAIDSSANQPVQAAIDVGGQQLGGNLQNLVDSDNGMMFIDGPGVLNYRSRPHMNSDTTTWFVSSAGPQYGIPFAADQTFSQDAQRVWNVIQASPYSPDGSSPPIITPSNATAAEASQLQYGPLPKSFTSYLQSTSEIQSQADWLLSAFGSQARRVTKLTVDAAQYPAAWGFVLNAAVSDVVQITDQPLQGGPLSVRTYRISSISRTIAFGANGNSPTAALTIIADPVPAGGFWT